MLLALCALGIGACGGSQSGSDDAAMILATTTSTQDSGLLDELIPRFQDDPDAR